MSAAELGAQLRTWLVGPEATAAPVPPAPLPPPALSPPAAASDPTFADEAPLSPTVQARAPAPAPAAPLTPAAAVEADVDAAAPPGATSRRASDALTTRIAMSPSGGTVTDPIARPAHRRQRRWVPLAIGAFLAGVVALGALAQVGLPTRQGVTPADPSQAPVSVAPGVVGSSPLAPPRSTPEAAVAQPAASKPAATAGPTPPPASNAGSGAKHGGTKDKRQKHHRGK
jgi:hypothetical protein